MKSSVAIAASLLLGASTVYAGSHHDRRHQQHELFHLKRAAAATGPSSYDNATCGCTTYTTTYYGEAALYSPPATETELSTVSVVPTAANETSSTPSSSAAPASSSAPTTEAPAGTYAPPPPPPAPTSTPSSSSSSSEEHPAPPTSAPEEHPAPKPSSKEVPPAPAPSSYAPPSSEAPAKAPSSSSAAPSPPPSKESGASIGGGKQWCMTYSPFTGDRGCKGAEDVKADIRDIAQRGFSSVRLYGPDCGAHEPVGSVARELGLKIVMGVFIDAEGRGKADEQVKDIISWGQWDLVELVVFGNEAIFNGFMSGPDLASFISSSKEKMQAAGYHGACTTTETLKVLRDNKDALCSVIDVVAANIHPFFNTETQADKAGEFVEKEMEGLKEICPGKDALNLETGWPTQGNSNGMAEPNYENQKKAIAGIMKVAGGKSALLSYRDDLWKEPGKLGVEQYWGCSDLF
ncbi:MAG: hypothetical protein M1837_003161 [Sclerophora amabilis]|nr:MAG: hypothetical protein M1837_003161 [Sclerophora amabilis]